MGLKNAFLSIPDLSNSFPESAEKSHSLKRISKLTLKSFRNRAKLHLRGPNFADKLQVLRVLQSYKFWASEAQFSSSYEAHATSSGSGFGSGSGG